MRIYVPSSLPLLRSWLSAGAIGPAPITGFALTPGLREWYVEGNTEELEFAATARAARASLRLVPGTEPRRVVVVVEVDDDQVTVHDELEEGAVRVSSPIGWRRVSCALVDATEAEPAVAQAITAIDAADLGHDEAAFVVSEAEDHDLQWFATQEIAGL